MAKDKANVQDIAEVHNMMNSVCKTYLGSILEDVTSDDPEVRDAGFYRASPAFLTMITGWLKHNNVTANPEVVKEVNELQLTLAEKRKKRVATVLPFDNYKDNYGT